MKLKAFGVDLTASTWAHGQHGAVTFTPVAGVPGEYTFVINAVTYNLFVYDITQTTFAINSNWPNVGSTGSFNTGGLHISGDVINAVTPASVIVEENGRWPIRNLVGTWTASGSNAQYVVAANANNSPNWFTASHAGQPFYFQIGTALTDTSDEVRFYVGAPDAHSPFYVVGAYRHVTMLAS